MEVQVFLRLMRSSSVPMPFAVIENILNEKYPDRNFTEDAIRQYYSRNKNHLPHKKDLNSGENKLLQELQQCSERLPEESSKFEQQRSTPLYTDIRQLREGPAD